MSAPLKLANRDARRLWLHAQGLTPTPTGKVDLGAMIRRLGFVQLDTIRVVARAHDHILWSRNQNYREPMLNRHMAEQRQVFEHFTHDASVIPIQFYPMWQRRFVQLEEKVRGWQWHRGMRGEHGRDAIKARIRSEGPLCTKAFDAKVRGKKQMWERPPHKRALDYMWYAGELSTSHRINFNKYYDLAERVIPAKYLNDVPSEADQIKWLCHAALERMAFGSTSDIQRFWAAVTRAEVETWVHERAGELVPVEIQAADGTWSDALAPGDIEQRLADVPVATSRLRIVNPFDPAIRDRARLSRLFGLEYTVEMFVPAAKRRWGYYVYPLLEGDRFVGRIEVKADRKAGRLNVLNVWHEPGVKWSGARAAKLSAELDRMARFIGVDDVVWAAA